VAALTVSSFGLVACDPVKYQHVDDTHTASTKLTEIHIGGGSGGVTLHRDAGATLTTIKRHFRFHGKQPDTNAWDSVDGSVLTLNTTCGPSCAVDYTITTPDTVTVAGHLDSGSMDLTGIAAATLETSSGTITVHDASGDVNAGSDSGALRINGVHGQLNAKTESGSAMIDRVSGATTVSTDSGEIRAQGLSGTQTSVRTSSGSVRLDLSTAQDLTAETDSGSLRVSVPSGSYKLTQSTDSGHVDIGIPLDNVNGEHTLHLKTQSGSITVRPM
jgi:hypothetical protein